MMANQNLYMAEAVDAIELNGIDHYDAAIAPLLGHEGRAFIGQADLITNPTYRLYVRVDQEATAGATLATFHPALRVDDGGDNADSPLWVDPLSPDPWYVHVLVTDATGVVQTGGADDRILVLAYKNTPR
jgi:hypothetical protein